MKIIVTGGAGFIGSAVVRHTVENTEDSVVCLDKLTYAGNLESLKSVADNPRYAFEKVDICDAKEVARVFAEHQPDAVMHLAAESHVDRSIDGPAAFVETNVVGTYVLLEAARAYLSECDDAKREAFRFLHVSTDEVYGSLGAEGLFEEMTPYDPRSPYSASKASSDHLVMAWYHTYGLPIVMTNCSNNYGPYHFPEKLVPLVTLNALDHKPLPIYGKGDNVRDWLYVEDHAKALYTVLTKGAIGEKYNVGGNSEMTNLDIVKTICAILDDLRPSTPDTRHPTLETYADLITFVADRPGHDKRYAIDATKIERELGWKPDETFESGIRKTIQWYLDNEWWWGPIRSGKYAGERLGKA